MKFEVLDKYNLVNFISDKSVDINYSKQSRDEIRSILQGISDYKFKKIISPRQTHTNNVVDITLDNLDSELNDVDGIITKLKGVALTIATADCQSIILYDKKNKVIGNIHSGWKSTLNKIIVNAVNLMRNNYGSNVKDIIVCIGPSIMGCCFEVDKDVVDMFTSNFDDIDEFIRLGEIKEGKQKYYIDTVGINKRELCNLGILEENIYLSNVCTKCSSDAYYSYRVHGQDSGRNVTLISMK
jgi:YfiH family protein